MANVRFRGIADGSPAIAVAQVAGRDKTNGNVAVGIQSASNPTRAVTVTELNPVIPNPMRGTAELAYSLAKVSSVDLSIYSVDGRRIKTLVHGQQGVGRYQFKWNGADDQGNPIQSGVYFVRLVLPGLQQTRVLAVVR